MRYIRKLFREPIARDGRWGLLYLMPGGQGIFDPGAAERQASGGGGPSVAGRNRPPGFTPIGQNVNGTGVPSPGGLPPGALPGSGGFPGSGAPAGGSPIVPPPTPPGGAAGEWGKEDGAGSVSEPPLGWPIVGVISRASGSRAENTFKVYKGHSQVNEWQFHVFERGIQLQQESSPVRPRQQRKRLSPRSGRTATISLSVFSGR